MTKNEAKVAIQIVAAHINNLGVKCDIAESVQTMSIDTVTAIMCKSPAKGVGWGVKVYYDVSFIKGTPFVDTIPMMLTHVDKWLDMRGHIPVVKPRSKKVARAGRFY